MYRKPYLGGFEMLSPFLSIVVPMFNEDGNVEKLAETIQDALSDEDFDYELILVDDGSTDNTWQLIQKMNAGNSRVKGLSLSRNFGHQNALFAGLHYAKGQAVVTMDGDLQHPPAVVREMYSAWKSGYKIVETRRIDNTEISWFKKSTSRAFYWVFSHLSGFPISPGTSDFRLMDATVVEIFKDMRDSRLFVRGYSHWIGFPRVTLEYHCGNRYAGVSKYSLRKMLSLSISSLFSFSTIPLKIGIWLGLCTGMIAMGELVYIFWAYAHGWTVSGWASTLAVVSFMFGVLFILIGILGTYLANILEILKSRPRFLVDNKVGEFAPR